MLGFITEYWLTFVFTIISGTLVGLAKYCYSLYQKEKKHNEEIQNNELKNEINNNILAIVEANREESNAADRKFDEQIKEINKDMSLLKGGILSIQGGDFKAQCRTLLQQDHVITLDEWDSLNADHEIYHSLGGNHDGDRLFDAVTTKYYNNLK